MDAALAVYATEKANSRTPHAAEILSTCKAVEER